ncbi:MAG: hypothetical protein WCC38_13010 [Pseudonocardiaceae bacterium]
MNANASSQLSQRDRAVLRAVDAGRCEISERFGGSLVIDGVWFSDQFAGLRLTEAGLIVAGPLGGPARLTASGRALLEAA